MAVSDPRFWGPSAWRLLHAVSFTYPVHPTQEDKLHYENFFKELRYVLPCPMCRHHFAQFMQANPIDLSSRKGLARWVYNAHDNVNKNNHKVSPTYETVEKAYLNASPALFQQLSTMTPEEQGHFLQNEYLELGGLTNSSETAKTTIDIVMIVLVVIIMALLIYKTYLDYRDQ